MSRISDILHRANSASKLGSPHRLWYVAKCSIGLCLLLLAPRVLPAQDWTYKRFDVEPGKKIFLSRCTVCHGLDGDSVRGVNLFRGKFRHASSADDIVEIIRDGIQDTGMPPIKVDPDEARQIVAYLLSMASAAPSSSAAGNPVRGKAIFEGKGECFNCHRISDKGSRFGPDLTDIGALRRAVELERSLKEPSAEILPENRVVRVVTREGITITGRLLDRDTFTVQLIDTSDRLRSFQVSELKEFAFLDQSAMPSYQSKLDTRELQDLLSYLASLKGVKPE
jgi:putative heme-binding domain-containing protein